MSRPEPVVYDRPELDDLEPLEEGSQVQARQTVYEVVRFGPSPDHVKFNPCRVVKVERAACVVQRLDGAHGGRDIKLHFKRVMVKKKAPPLPERLNTPFAQLPQMLPQILMTASPPALVSVKPAPAAPTFSDAFDAWLEMGKELVNEIEAERRGVEGAKAVIRGELQRIDEQHQQRIEELERQAQEARAAHERERAVAADALEAAEQRLRGIEARRAGLSKVLGDVTGAA